MSRELGFEAGERLLVVVMGVSGCGKSTVARKLADALGGIHLEGDSLHSPGNLAKMARGIALTDEDRWPWLDRIGEAMASFAGPVLVLSCSALRRSYRDRLRSRSKATLVFVHLDGAGDLLAQRLAARRGHFMPASMLESQLATLEHPAGEPDVVVVGIHKPIEAVVAEALARLADTRPR